MRPVIGITAWRRRLDTYLGSEVLQTLSAYYSDAVVSAGMTPLMFANGQAPGEAERLVALVDGVLVSGGDDVDPATYGADTIRASGRDDSVDAFEMAVIRAARAQDKPLLAICRGLQIMNVTFGGTLCQDVTGSDGVHGVISDESDPAELNARSHSVLFEGGSVMAGIYDAPSANVNTLHHQGIDRLGEGLVVEGRTDDGLIEAARWNGEWWALGVQWHPERMDGHHRRVFDAFRQAVMARG